MLLRVLLALDPPASRRRVARLLEAPGLDVTAVSASRHLWEELTRQDADLVVAGSAGAPPSPDQIAAIRALPDSPEIIVLRPREDAEERARLLASGCLAVLWLGLADPILSDTLQALGVRCRDELLRRLQTSRGRDRPGLSDFASESLVMQRFLTIARRVVPSDSALLVLGETGVGKERVARAIHYEGPRSAGPFLAVNCGALPETLLETELFGHEEGAFTGAGRAHRGYFELAHRGTIFLDEIGEMPTHMQVKLLRVLEERQVRRVGGERSREVDVRIMAATNRDPEAEVRAGRFRADLYYRLAVVTLTVPPLRERPEDVSTLVRQFLSQLKPVRGQTPAVHHAALEALVAYDWPGNVRELANVLERAVLLCHGPEIQVADLPGRVVAARAPRATADAASGVVSFDPAWFDRPLRAARSAVQSGFEREYLERLLTSTQGRIGETARRAGIDPRTLYGLMRRHGLSRRLFRS